MNKHKNFLIWFILNISLAVTARAALHGNEQSVYDDSNKSAATITTEALSNYTIHTLTLPSGTKVKEYLSTNGQVFAVTWNGPLLPNFEMILGSHIKDYQAATNTNSSRRGPLIYQQPDIVIESAGHIRAFNGRAYLPTLLPMGLKLEEIN